MKERNKHTLRSALDALPERTPPNKVWRGLERELTPNLAKRLPTYQPPASVWNGLSEELARAQVPGSESKEPGSATVRRLPWKWMSIAASLLLVAFVGYGLLSRPTGPKVTLAHTQEVAPSAVLPDWDQDESSFNSVLAQLDAVNEPELNTLKMELTELTEAKEDIKAMLAAYGEDPSVVRQLAEIERGRSDVYRKIILLL